ncbi:MAG: ATP-binding protein [Chloroflexota bacterium]
MLYLDLKWVLLTIFFVLVGVPSLVVWLNGRQQATKGKRLSLLDTSGADILAQAPFGTLTVQAQNHYHSANAYACRLLGLEMATGVLPDADWVSALQEDRKTVRQGQADASRYRLIALPYNQFGQWWVFPSGDHDIVFLLDVTMQQQMHQHNQLLFNGFSHELRTPIATIATHLEVLNVPDITPEIKTQSQHILKMEARRMSRLVDQMADLGRLTATEAPELRALHLSQLVEDIVAQLRPAANDKDVQLTLEADSPLPVIMGDEYRLKQVFINLLDNGLKYASAGSEVRVSLLNVTQGVLCVVHDNGPGIPAEHVPYVTRHFYRVDKQVNEGSGLGLAIVDQILQNHQSKLLLESATAGDQTGTRVSFTLPTLAHIEPSSQDGVA